MRCCYSTDVKRSTLLISIGVAVVSVALFIYINLFSSFGIAASFKNPISKPDLYGRRHTGFLFLLPLFIEVVCLLGILNKNYEIVTNKPVDIDFSCEIALGLTLLTYGMVVYFLHWGIA